MTSTPPDDLAAQCRQVADALNDKDWVKATFQARQLLFVVADEIERLRAENASLKATGEAFGPAMQMMVAKLKERQW
jgi:hypothetical protein